MYVRMAFRSKLSRRKIHIAAKVEQYIATNFSKAYNIVYYYVMYV